MKLLLNSSKRPPEGVLNFLMGFLPGKLPHKCLQESGPSKGVLKVLRIFSTNFTSNFLGASEGLIFLNENCFPTFPAPFTGRFWRFKIIFSAEIGDVLTKRPFEGVIHLITPFWRCFKFAKQIFSTKILCLHPSDGVFELFNCSPCTLFKDFLIFAWVFFFNINLCRNLSSRPLNALLIFVWDIFPSAPFKGVWLLKKINENTLKIPQAPSWGRYQGILSSVNSHYRQTPSSWYFQGFLFTEIFYFFCLAPFQEFFDILNSFS